ncbi:MAG: hypothetical protein AB8B50_03700 [Pirellulaceae bacterium]
MKSGRFEIWPRNGWMVALVWGLAIAGFNLTAAAQEAATLEKPAAAPDPKTDEASEKKSSNKTEKDLEFVRVLKEGKKPVALQTANVRYQKPGVVGGPEITLIGAVHIGEATYYSRLNQAFRKFDALLFEMVMDPDMDVPDPEERGVSPVSTIQTGMKDALGLTFQLDEIDYKANNFVHADMTPTEFFETMEKRNDGLWNMMLRSVGSSLAMQSSGQSTGDVALLAGLMSSDREKAMRRAFADQLQLMDGQMAALTDEEGKSTLITERNAKAFKVMDRELAAGKKNLGIFYGAGHLKDMHKRLTEEYGMVPVETEWVSAWDLK